jgi:hypothetical protein
LTLLGVGACLQFVEFLELAAAHDKAACDDQRITALERERDALLQAVRAPPPAPPAPPPVSTAVSEQRDRPQRAL